MGSIPENKPKMAKPLPLQKIGVYATPSFPPFWVISIIILSKPNCYASPHKIIKKVKHKAASHLELL